MGFFGKIFFGSKIGKKGVFFWEKIVKKWGFFEFFLNSKIGKKKGIFLEKNC